MCFSRGFFFPLCLFVAIIFFRTKFLSMQMRWWIFFLVQRNCLTKTKSLIKMYEKQISSTSIREIILLLLLLSFFFLGTMWHLTEMNMLFVCLIKCNDHTVDFPWFGKDLCKYCFNKWAVNIFCKIISCGGSGRYNLNENDNYGGNKKVMKKKMGKWNHRTVLMFSLSFHCSSYEREEDEKKNGPVNGLAWHRSPSATIVLMNSTALNWFDVSKHYFSHNWDIFHRTTFLTWSLNPTRNNCGTVEQQNWQRQQETRRFYWIHLRNRMKILTVK